MANILDQFGAIRAVVNIQTPPTYDPDTGLVIPRQLYGFDTGERGGPADDLISVATQKNIEQPAGRFQLVFTPREVVQGKTWVDLIPPYSLVEILVQRYPHDEEPRLVMVGLSDAQMESEDYSNTQPQRTVQISGYELSVLLADQKILYLPLPPDQRNALTAPALFAGARDSFGRTSQVNGLPREDVEAVRRDLGVDLERPILPPTASSEIALLAGKDDGNQAMLAIDPQLSKFGDSPIAVIDRVVRMLTVGEKTDFNRNGSPLVNFDFPDAKLKDLLFFDKARATLFDPRAELAPSAQINAGTNLWNLLTTFSDDLFQELFTRSVDFAEAPPTSEFERALGSESRLSDVSASARAVEIVFRKRPFAGRINEKGEVVGVAAPNGSQFDRGFANSETIEITGADAVSWNLMRNSRDVTNVYLVYPRLPNFNSPEEQRAVIAPLVDEDRLNPSSVRRFGPRLMEVQDVFLQAKPRGDSPYVTVAQAREQLLWAWYRFNPLFRSGQYLIRGNAKMQVGKRLVHESRRFRREYYITGVGHSLTFGQAPSWVTTLNVERGWNL